MSTQLIVAGASVVVALIAIAIIFARRSAEDAARAKLAKEMADATREANKELAKPRTRKSVANKLRDGKF